MNIPCDVTLHPTNPLLVCRVLTILREQHRKYIIYVIHDNACKQACLPKSETGVETGQTVEQLKVAYVWSVLQSNALVE